MTKIQDTYNQDTSGIQYNHHQKWLCMFSQFEVNYDDTAPLVRFHNQRFQNLYSLN